MNTILFGMESKDSKTFKCAITKEVPQDFLDEHFINLVNTCILLFAGVTDDPRRTNFKKFLLMTNDAHIGKFGDNSLFFHRSHDTPLFIECTHESIDHNYVILYRNRYIQHRTAGGFFEVFGKYSEDHSYDRFSMTAVFNSELNFDLVKP